MRDAVSVVPLHRSGGKGNCGWCSSPDGKSWTAAVLEGESLRSVASRTPYSASAASRHMRHHVRNTLRSAVEMEPGQAPADFASRLMSLADDAARLRVHARETGNASLLIRAMASERDALTALMTRLGVDDHEVVEHLVQAGVLTRAMVDLVHEDPDLAGLLARAIEAAGDPTLAEDVRAYGAQRMRKLPARPSLVPEPVR